MAQAAEEYGSHDKTFEIQKAGTVTDTAKIASTFKDTLPMKGIQGTQMAFGGRDTYGKDAQFKTVNYIGVIRNGKTVVVESATPPARDMSAATSSAPLMSSSFPSRIRSRMALPRPFTPPKA